MTTLLEQLSDHHLLERVDQGDTASFEALFYRHYDRVYGLRSVVLLPLVFWRCFRMPRRWPWSEFDTYLDVPLAEIRREYGIRIRVP